MITEERAPRAPRSFQRLASGASFLFATNTVKFTDRSTAFRAFSELLLPGVRFFSEADSKMGLPGKYDKANLL